MAVRTGETFYYRLHVTDYSSDKQLNNNSCVMSGKLINLFRWINEILKYNILFLRVWKN